MWLTPDKIQTRLIGLDITALLLVFVGFVSSMGGGLPIVHSKGDPLMFWNQPLTLGLCSNAAALILLLIASFTRSIYIYQVEGKKIH